MSQSTNAEYISWSEVEDFIKTLKTQITDDCKGIYGIPRGGTVLATMLSYATGLPILHAPIRGCVIIDDIADSGKTLLHYKEKGYAIVTMCYKATSVVKPDYYFKETAEWVVFPWEGGYDESK